MAVYSTRTGSIATTAAATKSLWLLNPVSDFFLIAEFGVSFAAAASSATIGIELYRVTTIGTPAGTTATVTKIQPVADAGTATTTGLTALTTEPTAVEVLAEWELQPFGGVLDIQYPLGRELQAGAAGGRVGLRYTTPAAVNPNARSYVWFAER